MRTSRLAVEKAFTTFVHNIGAHVAKAHDDVGGYRLDYNSVYGGYNIECIWNEQGAVSHPFGDRRRPASEMLSTLNFVFAVLGEMAWNEKIGVTK